MTRYRRFSFWVAAAIAWSQSAVAFAQCAMCRASLLHSQGGAELIAGLRQGVLLLLAVPLVISAIVLLGIYRATARPVVRKPRAATQISRPRESP